MNDSIAALDSGNNDLSVLATTAPVVVKSPEATIPISFVRSALFSVARDGPRLERKPIAAEQGPLGIEITYSGPHLNQEHFKVWQSLVHLGKVKDMLNGDTFVTPANEILRGMGKDYRDHDQRILLWRLLEDLQQASVYLASRRSRYRGGLVMAVARDEVSGHIAIRLNPELSQLLTDETLENDMLRMVSLGKDQIAIWLHNYYASWGSYRNLGVKEIQRLCGTKLDLKRFRYRLKKALEKLKGGIRPFITDWRIDDNDVVFVTKVPTKVKLLSDEDREKSGLIKLKDKNDVARKAAEARSRVVL